MSWVATAHFTSPPALARRTGTAPLPSLSETRLSSVKAERHLTDLHPHRRAQHPTQRAVKLPLGTARAGVSSAPVLAQTNPSGCREPPLVMPPPPHARLPPAASLVTDWAATQNGMWLKGEECLPQTPLSLENLFNYRTMKRPLLETHPNCVWVQSHQTRLGKTPWIIWYVSRMSMKPLQTVVTVATGSLELPLNTVSGMREGREEANLSPDVFTLKAPFEQVAYSPWGSVHRLYQ